jgi:hypothetical protein
MAGLGGRRSTLAAVLLSIFAYAIVHPVCFAAWNGDGSVSIGEAGRESGRGGRCGEGTALPLAGRVECAQVRLVLVNDELVLACELHGRYVLDTTGEVGRRAARVWDLQMEAHVAGRLVARHVRTRQILAHREAGAVCYVTIASRTNVGDGCCRLLQQRREVDEGKLVFLRRAVHRVDAEKGAVAHPQVVADGGHRCPTPERKDEQCQITADRVAAGCMWRPRPGG